MDGRWIKSDYDDIDNADDWKKNKIELLSITIIISKTITNPLPLPKKT